MITSASNPKLRQVRRLDRRARTGPDGVADTGTT
jgi:hypothetical protein